MLWLLERQKAKKAQNMTIPWTDPLKDLTPHKPAQTGNHRQSVRNRSTVIPLLRIKLRKVPRAISR